MPAGIDGSAGVIAIAVSAAGVTVKAVDPETDPDVAVIVVAPTATVLARPCVPAPLLIVAMLVAVEFQFAVEVRLRVLPSE